MFKKIITQRELIKSLRLPFSRKPSKAMESKVKYDRKDKRWKNNITQGWQDTKFKIE